MFFIFDTELYGSNTGGIKNCNELIKNVLNPTTRKIQGLLSNFEIKSRSKYVITGLTTFTSAIKKEKRICL